MISDYPKTNLAAANRDEFWKLSGPVTRRSYLLERQSWANNASVFQVFQMTTAFVLANDISIVGQTVH